MEDCYKGDNCTCTSDGLIRHFVRYNGEGEPICCMTLTDETLERWKREQTPEQLELTEWIKAIQRKSV